MFVAKGWRRSKGTHQEWTIQRHWQNLAQDAERIPKKKQKKAYPPKKTT